MKKFTLFVLSFLFWGQALAFGPYELHFNGLRYYKIDEKPQGRATAAEYAPDNPHSPARIILTHVLDKDDPNQVANGLKEKKSVAIVDVQALKEDRSDLLVQFVQFELENLKVKHNLCRIIKDDQIGSIVFQYFETQRLKNESEGAVSPDFTQLAENMKQLPIHQFLYSNSQPHRARTHHHDRLPWYKRPDRWAGHRPAPFDFRP